jgi:hypothetical protein
VAVLWVQRRFLSAAGPVVIADGGDTVEDARRIKVRVRIGAASRSRYFLCQRCGSHQLRAAIVEHLRQPEIGLSECAKIQHQARKDAEKAGAR